jgi:hypothetical protein
MIVVAKFDEECFLKLLAFAKEDSRLLEAKFNQRPDSIFTIQNNQ